MTRARWLCAAGAWVVVGLIAATSATAASLSVRIRTDAATLVYRAAPGERNHVGIGGEYPPASGVYSVSFGAHTALGPGCEPDAGDPRRTARCTLRPGLRHEASIRLGDRDDTASLEDAGELTGRITGGPGDDAITGPANQSDRGLPLWLWLALEPPQPQLRPASAGESAAPAHLWGGPGADELWGGLGDDVLDPGPGVDLVIGTRGKDTILARDGEFDYIRCGSGLERLKLDRWDLAWSRCGRIGRHGAPMAVPLNVFIDWDDLEDTFIIVGCPSDMPRGCKGVLTLAVRGGRPVHRARFRFSPGRIGTKRAFLDYDEMDAIVERGAKLTVEAPAGAGRPRSLSRNIRVEGEPAPD